MGSGAPSFDPELIGKLAEARISGADVDGTLIPGDLETAQQVQLAVLRRLEDEGHRVAGWKVGLTSGDARDLFGPGVRPVGFILEDRVLESGAVIVGGLNQRLGLEPEIWLEIGAELRGAALTPEACRAAVSQVCAGFEINRMRTTMPGQNELFVADGLGNWGTVRGEGIAPRDGLSATRATLFIDGEAVRSTSSRLVFDDPFLSLSRLCATLDRYGLGLRPGQHVIAGSLCRRWDVERRGHYVALFEGVGEVSLHIT
jgi:2-keto-4-pentenoate hydratase